MGRAASTCKHTKANLIKNFTKSLTFHVNIPYHLNDISMSMSLISVILYITYTTLIRIQRTLTKIYTLKEL